MPRTRWLWLLVLAPLLVGCVAGSPALTSSPTATLEPDVGQSTDIATEQTAAESTPERRDELPTVVRQTATPRPSPAPRPEPPVEPGGAAVVVERGLGGRPEIALTIDAGAERGDAERILDILTEYGVVASFGVTGEWAKANPDLLQRMVGEGHMLLNHGWSHRLWTGRSTAADPGDPTTWTPLSQEERLEELERTEAIVGELTGYDLRPYFRPPYADLDDGVLEDLAFGGYPIVVMWSCESLAWMGWTAEEIVDHCATDAQSGDVVLLHVTDGGTDSAALPLLIETLRAQGLAFVTVEQIVQPH